MNSCFCGTHRRLTRTITLIEAGRPIFVAHGTLDPMLPVERGRAMRETLERLGADLTYREYVMGHQIVAPELADFNVVRLHTRSFPYPACVSVQLNELGLGAVVPDTARFPNAIASRGV